MAPGLSELEVSPCHGWPLAHIRGSPALARDFGGGKLGCSGRGKAVATHASSHMEELPGVRVLAQDIPLGRDLQAQRSVRAPPRDSCPDRQTALPGREAKPGPLHGPEQDSRRAGQVEGGSLHRVIRKSGWKGPPTSI